MAKLVKLKGYFTGEAQVSTGGDYIEKDVRMVYPGEFESIEGEVVVTEDHVQLLHDNHNADYQTLSAAGPVAMVNCPPIQLDHSQSARDTVGRLVGPLRIEEFEGKKALFGRMRILGKENVEPVKDGRWANVSIGADLEAGKLNELSITPFPAAPKAAMLSKGGQKSSEGDDMDHEKLRKHLMESEKMSEKDADDKLAKMTDDEKKELSAKLAGPPVEEKKEEKKDEKHMSVSPEQKGSFVKLAKGFRKAASTVSLAAKQMKIRGRFVQLRAAAKVTPVELKAQDFVKLAKLSKEALDAVFESYEKRQPVILVGQHGSTKAQGVSLAVKDAASQKMLSEMAETMHFSKGVLKKLSGGAMPTSMDQTEQMSGATDPHEQMKAHLSHLGHLLETQQHDAAKEHLKTCMSHLESMRPAGGTEPEGEQREPEGHEPSHLSALAENVENLQNQFEDLVKLAGPVIGVTEEELSKEE